MEAVRFHPESILTLSGSCGLKLMENVVRVFRARAGAAQALVKSCPGAYVTCTLFADGAP